MSVYESYAHQYMYDGEHPVVMIITESNFALTSWAGDHWAGSSWKGRDWISTRAAVVGVGSG